MRRLALQILQKTIREVILRSLAPGVLLALRAAVRTGVFHRILLRIAVQSGPARAAYTYCFYITPVHGIALLRIHVHKRCDALTPHFGTVPRKYSISKHFEPFPVSIALSKGFNRANPTDPTAPTLPSLIQKNTSAGNIPHHPLPTVIPTGAGRRLFPSFVRERVGLCSGISLPSRAPVKPPTLSKRLLPSPSACFPRRHLLCCRYVSRATQIGFRAGVIRHGRTRIDAPRSFRPRNEKIVGTAH